MFLTVQSGTVMTVEETRAGEACIIFIIITGPFSKWRARPFIGRPQKKSDNIAYGKSKSGSFGKSTHYWQGASPGQRQKT
ncbi:MAG: hypothetical protein JO266_09075 [Acidobacteria bacterium]|nr:hypothetical protein [Acidobacteriota bacterium]